MKQFARLALQGTCQGGMVMAQAGDRDAAGKIEIGLALIVVQPGTLPLDEVHLLLAIGGRDRGHAHPVTSNSKKVKAITPGYLRNLALWYLERFGGTRARVRRTLQKRVLIAAQEYGPDQRAEG